MLLETSCASSYLCTILISFFMIFLHVCVYDCEMVYNTKYWERVPFFFIFSSMFMKCHIKLGNKLLILFQCK